MALPMRHLVPFRMGSTPAHIHGGLRGLKGEAVGVQNLGQFVLT